jgi:hypothetical protein
MAKKHMKMCSPSLTIKETQIKILLRFHLTALRMAIIKNTNINKCWQGSWEKGTLYTVGENLNKCNHYRKKSSSKN